MSGARRFDFVALEMAALEAWAEWDRRDCPATRTELFKRIYDLSYGVVSAGNFEKKFKLDYLGSDPSASLEEAHHEVAYEYSVYLVERLLSRSKVLRPKSCLARVDLPHDAPEADVLAAVTRLAKHPVTLESWEPGSRTETGPDGVAREVRHLDVRYRFNKFALNAYITINIRAVVLARRGDGDLQDVLDALEESARSGEDPAEAAREESEPGADRLSRAWLARSLRRALSAFYDDSEVRRLFWMAVEAISGHGRGLMTARVPEDVRDFALVTLALIKRLTDGSRGTRDQRPRDVRQALQSAVRSSVFLSSAVGTGLLDRDLLLALDMESLYRLVLLRGGREIRVPTQRELDTLVGTTAAIAEALVDGRDPEKAIRAAKAELGLTFSHRLNVRNFVSQALDSYDLIGEEGPGRPLVDVLLRSLACLEDTLADVRERARGAPAGELATMYSELVRSCSRLADSLVNASLKGRAAMDDGGGG